MASAVHTAVFRPQAVHKLCSSLVTTRFITVQKAPGRVVKAEPEAQGTEASDEARLEAVERVARKGKGEDVQQVEQQIKEQREFEARQVVWKEGELFPEKWEEMTVGEKVTQIYMGERGLLFWSNKLATGALFVVGFVWVVFRFVGPGLGLYDLAGGPPQQ